jgi:hypothetical protein
MLVTINDKHWVIFDHWLYRAGDQVTLPVSLANMLKSKGFVTF